MKVRTVVLLASALLLSGFANQASACTCGESTVAEDRERATAVFVGKVISKRKSDAVEKDGVEVTLKVERVWKGQVSENAIVYTGATDDLYPSLNLCATLFVLGQKYIVFAYGQDKITTDVCTGSGGFPYAKNVIKELGRGTRPLKSNRRIEK